MDSLLIERYRCYQFNLHRYQACTVLPSSVTLSKRGTYVKIFYVTDWLNNVTQVPSSDDDFTYCCGSSGNTTEDTCCRSGTTDGMCHCHICNYQVLENMSRGLKLVGGIGLFFSFTEVSWWCYLKFCFSHHVPLLSVFIISVSFPNLPQSLQFDITFSAGRG